MALQRRRRNVHAGQILQLAARLFIAVGTGGIRIEALRAGRDRPALQTQRAVQLVEAAAAVAATETGPLDPDRPKARPERLRGPAVPLRPPAAARAGRRRIGGVARLQQIRAGLRSEIERPLADRRLDRVQIRNPADPKLRLQPRKRTAELRLGRRMHRVHLIGPAAGRAVRLELATAHMAVLKPLPRDNAVILENQRRLLRRLLARQTLQKRHRLRMAEPRVLRLARHDALCCSRPDARRPPFASLPKSRSGIDPC